jgi:antitoxin Phd
MSRIAVIDARKDLADILNRAAYGKERVVLTRRGKDVAAIVPIDDLNMLEAIEDHMDLAESKKILDRVRAGSEQFLSLAEVKAKYEVPSRKSVRPAKKSRKDKR